MNYYTVHKLQTLKKMAGKRKVPDDDNEESSDEEGGGVDYTMTELISFAALKKKKVLKCDGDKCNLAAFSVWTGDDGDVFNSCADCCEK